MENLLTFTKGILAFKKPLVNGEYSYFGAQIEPLESSYGYVFEDENFKVFASKKAKHQKKLERKAKGAFMGVNTAFLMELVLSGKIRMSESIIGFFSALGITVVLVEALEYLWGKASEFPVFEKKMFLKIKNKKTQRILSFKEEKGKLWVSLQDEKKRLWRRTFTQEQFTQKNFEALGKILQGENNFKENGFMLRTLPPLRKFFNQR